MIENFEPSTALLAYAPAVTAIVYTGDVAKPVELADLALGVESGEVVPLAGVLFLPGGEGPNNQAAEDSEPVSLIDLADLLRCEPSPAALSRVAALAQLQAANAVAERRKELACTPVATLKKPPKDPMSGSMEALLAAMDAAAAARAESLTP